VSRTALSGIPIGRAGISPKMPVRLSIALGTSAEATTYGTRNETGVASESRR
jgi:plasmid maintenance system antidote protein VapI